MSPRRRIFPIFIPFLGCPQQCVFCEQRQITGQSAPFGKKNVEDALSRLPDAAGYELAFYGGSFTAVPVRLQEDLLSAAVPARERGAIAAIRVSTRPDAVDEEALSRLKRYGVNTVELGAQSMDDSVLTRSRRGHSSSDTRRAAEAVKNAGFSLILQMMTGLPGSDDEKDVRTAEELIKLRPDGVRIYPTVILRGTELERLWSAGDYREHTVEDAVRICARILPLFESAHIPVIRLGLNPTDELSGGEASGGAYHPALGELVRSRILRQRAEKLLDRSHLGDRVCLGVSPERISAMIGQHRCNIAFLREKYGLRELCVIPDPEAGNGIVLHPASYMNR